MVVFAFDFLTRLSSAIHGKDLFMSVTSLFTVAIVCWIILTAEKDRRSRTVGVRIHIHGEMIQVESSNGVVEYPFKKVGGYLEPSLSPIAFRSAERFGTSGNSILIDRRFLKPIA